MPVAKSGGLFTTRRTPLVDLLRNVRRTPSCAGPVAFALVVLALTGDTSGVAEKILALTLAQVIGAIAIKRFEQGLPLTTFL